MTTGEGTSYGTGGKFRKKSSRRPQPTPYDRPPPTSFPNPKNNGWLPKLVDPASKLILSTARSFFFSLARKRLPPALPPEANRESRDQFQDAVPNNSPGVPTKSCDSSGISKLEQILKQKSFSRSEVDHLTELLHSKTIDRPNGDGHRMGEIDVPRPLSAYGIQQNVSSSPMRHNVIETHLENRFHGHVSTPLISSHVSEEDVASPVEIAKAYMGSRSSKVSPSMLGLRSQALREDANLLDNVSFPPMSFPPKTPSRVGIPENGFMNPRSRGRSAIYNMARTPYSNVNPTASQKGPGSVFDSYGGPSASPSSLYAWEHDAQHGSKQLALKRRSSALEDDIGSTTPIRRLRQKISLSTPQNFSLPAYRSTLSSRGKPFPVEEPKYRTLHAFGENEDNSTPSTSYTPVPSNSSEMATRILQQLEKLVPKEKPSEGKVVTGRDKSPSKLTPSMLRGQALRSLENVDSSKILQNALDSHKLEELRDTSQLDARETTSQKQDKVEENGPKKSIVSHEAEAPAVTSGTTVSVKDTVPGVHTADSVVTAPLTQPPQKKWAFHMSAHEDFLDLDDDIHPVEATSTPLSQEEEEKEKFMVESKVAYTEALMVSKTSSLSGIKPPDGPLITNSVDLGTSDASVAGEKNTSFTFLTAPASSSTFQPVVTALQSTSAFDSIIPLKESNSTLAFFSADSKIVDKVPSLSFSSSSAVSESIGLKFNAPLESKAENSNSLANIASGTAIVEPKVPESDKGDYKDLQKSVEMTVQSEILSSATVSASSIFSFAATANISGLSNGPFASSPIFSSPAPVPVSVDFTNQKIGKSLTNTAPSTTVTISTNDAIITSASNGSVSTSSASSFPVAPIFNFGPSSGTSSNPVSTISTTSSLETTDLKAKTIKESTLGNGNLSNAPLGGTSFETASTESNIFGFSAAAAATSTSSVNNRSQSSHFGTTSGSLAITHVSPAETGVATVTQSMPIQFGSSFTSSSSVFGSSNSSSPLFSSSTSPKLFDSTFSFGLSSSSASSSQTNTISSSGAATSSFFSSSWQPTATPSVSPSTVFAFGAPAVSVASTSNAPMVFGSGIPTFTALSGNGDQMSIEDSMSEDPVQGSVPAVPVFGQPSISAPSSGFMFGSTVSSGGIPSFQFGNPPNQSTPQLPPPFQQSGSLEFAANNSFSLGSGGGGDKSGRKIVKVRHKARRRP